MDADSGPPEEALRAEVHEALLEPGVRASLGAMWSGQRAASDPRPLMGAIGERGLLNVGMPREAGGWDAGYTGAAIVIEELARCGIADAGLLFGVHTIGQLLRLAGTTEQRSRLLPGIATGERLGVVLGRVGRSAVTARPHGDGHLLNGSGTAAFRLASTDLAVCRTEIDGGAALFVVGLHQPGVAISHSDPFVAKAVDIVEMHDVYVSRDERLGEPGDADALLARTDVVEQTGLDGALEAARCYSAAIEGYSEAETDGALLERVGRYGALVEAARAVAAEAVARLDAGLAVPAAAEPYALGVARDVATWASLESGFGYRGRAMTAAARLTLAAAGRAIVPGPRGGGTDELIA
jgi:alkylation response protein AidB-like acyl-CoA dehydrogenase